MGYLEARPAADARPPEARRTAFVLGALVFAVALVVRLIYAAQAADCPLFAYPTIDAGTYYLLARDFANGHWLHPLGEPFWQPPFYPAVLGLWMKLGGDSVFAAKCAQFVIGSFSCSLVFILGARVFGKRAGVVAGMMAAVYGPLIYFDGELLTPTLQVFLNLCAIVLLLSVVERPAPWRFAAAGLVLGLSIITRPDVAVFVAAASVWAFVALRARSSASKASRGALLFVLCAALPVVPVAVRNRMVGGDAVLISSNGGLNFYIGNNPHYEQTLAIRPGPEWDDLVELGRSKDPDAKQSEQSARFYDMALDYIRSQPLDWTRLMLKKSLVYVTSVEGRRNHDMYFLRRYSALFSMLLFRVGSFAFPLGLILPLAVIGIVRRPRGAETALLLAYIGAQFAATVAFFVVARYRVTVAPVLLVFAARGAVELCRMIRRRRVSCVALAAAGVAFVICNANLPGVDRDRRLIDSDSHFFVAGILDGDGKKRQAIPEYERAIRLNPRFFMSRMNYGKTLFELGRWQDAVRQLRAARRLHDGAHQADWLLGEAYVRLKDYPAALRHYRAAVKADGIYVDGLAHVGLEAYERGDYHFAVDALRIVVSARPEYPQAHHSLGLALFMLGRLDASIAELRTTCRLDPSSSETWLALGIAYDRAGRRKQANAAFARAISIGPRARITQRIRTYLGTGGRR